MNKEIICQAAAPKKESIDIPEFQHEGQPVTLTIQALSSEQANRILGEDTADPDNAVARWIAESVIDENGNRPFTKEDHPVIRTWGARGVRRLHDAILRLNGLGGQAEKN